MRLRLDQTCHDALQRFLWVPVAMSTGFPKPLELAVAGVQLWNLLIWVVLYGMNEFDLLVLLGVYQE